jgi:parallel beta-helix repeat protein
MKTTVTPSAMCFQALRVGAMGLLLAGCGAPGEQQLGPVETVESRIGGAEYFVATTGNDSNPGTLASPWRTVQRAVSLVKAGDFVNIRGGVYRESVLVWASGNDKNPITFQSYNGESVTITASDVVGGWSLHKGSIYKKTGWKIDSQQVFDNGAPLSQIGQPGNYDTFVYDKPRGGVSAGVAQLATNTFYYDRNAATLYVWLSGNANPNSRTMEVSVRTRPMTISGSYITLKGLRFRHSNAGGEFGTNTGAMVELGDHSRVIQCDVQWADFAGISMGWQRTGSVVEGSTVMNNGCTGIQTGESPWFEIRGNRIAYNRTRPFNPGWSCGGIKIIPNAAGMIEANEIDHNPGMGVWFDWCKAASKFYIRNNYIHDNVVGIVLEVSTNGAISNNIVANNTGGGIVVAASNSMLVISNTIVGTGGWSAVEVSGMPREGNTLRNNTIINNIIANNTTVQDLYMYRDQADISGNVSDYNLFYRKAGYPVLIGQSYYVDGTGQHWTRGPNYDLPSFRAATGWDQHSVFGDPRFITQGWTSYAIDRSSPAFNTGSSNFSWDSPLDFTWLPRPAVGAHDIGAYEAR